MDLMILVPAPIIEWPAGFGTRPCTGLPFLLLSERTRVLSAGWLADSVQRLVEC